MTIRIIRANPPCAASEILMLEGAVKSKVPADFISFLAKHNGAFPEVNLFRLTNGLGGTITQFFSVELILATKKAMIDRFPSDLWPIAQTESGNLILIRFAAPYAILFWDHETEEIFMVASSFLDFLESLQAYHASEVPLMPDQIVEAWIDPDFLKSISVKGQ